MRDNLAVIVSILICTVALSMGCRIGNHNPNSNASTAKELDNRRELGISRDEFERQKKRLEKEARDQGRKIGNSRDLWLWTRIRAALAYNDDLRDAFIAVDVENEVVTLSGTVLSDDQKSKAEEIARSIDGIKSVKNDLNVGAPDQVG